MSVKSFISVAALAALASPGTSIVSAQVTINTVAISNPGNAADARVMNDGTSGYGSVAYAFNIARTEVTNAQYAAFLNAKAASDPFNLYNTEMAGPFGGIIRSGSAGSYTYSVGGRANHPVNFVSFWDATRFANWLHNGQGDGDTETGAYTLGGVTNPVNESVTRNANWQWAVTSEDEWYKAAFHQPASAGGDSDDYWLYPTSSNSVPTTAQANIFGNGINNTRPVGSYVANYYGTFDMAGNVWERNEAIIGSFRGLRGGSFFNNDASFLPASFRTSSPPTFEVLNVGFRLSQKIPSCPADFNRNGSVDLFDYLDFVSAFAADSPTADFNGNNVVDLFDYLDFVQAFSTDC
ncbi:MAG: SUMF1/EgtB/PvdO family nonheme iron enzyme [Planctomycetota bacterium]|nr:SUMF1/EgtB/PvdO family nonheme iron enzyme [Planctomycetota bacterium]